MLCTYFFMGYVCFIIARYMVLKVFRVSHCKNSTDDDVNLDSKTESKSEAEIELNEDNDDTEELDNNNLITVKPDHNYKGELSLSTLNLPKGSSVYNLHDDKDTILNVFKSKSGIYLLHNNVNGKCYIGSGVDLRRRLGSYYSPSRLIDGRHISNSLLKYGHSSFSLVVLVILGNTGTVVKTDIINKEQMFIDLYKPTLNINPRAGSSLGFKHSSKSKELISQSRKGKPLSEATKKRLSLLLSGELNPF